MKHSIYEAMLQGFLAVLNNEESTLDEYNKEMDSKYYETGRHLASYMLHEKLDVTIVNIETIYATYTVLKGNIYQNGRKSGRARN